jgi:hypothetical protein
LLHPSGTFSIEIHKSLIATQSVNDEFERILRTADMFERAVAILWNGHSVLALHPTDRIVHNIVHTQIHDGRFSLGTIELRQMRELALLAARHGHAVDWRDIEHRFSSAGHADVLAEQAALCLALMGVPLPVAAADIGNSMNRLCHGVERTAAAAVADHQHGVEPVRRGPHLSAPAVLTKLAREYVAGFLADPLLALNLFNPLWWPARIRGIWRILKRRDVPDFAMPQRYRRHFTPHE